MKKMLLMLVLASAFLVGAFYDFNTYNTVEVVRIARPGDTLWGIADGMMDRQDKYRDVREMIYYIEERNKGVSLSPLMPGTEIVIPLHIKQGK